MSTLKHLLLTVMEMLWRMTFIWTFYCSVPGTNLNDMGICFLEFQKSTYKMWDWGRQKINCQKSEALSWWERKEEEGWLGRQMTWKGKWAMWLHGCFTHITAPVRADRYTPLEESKHIVGLAHLRVHVPAHMCCSLSRAAKCLRQASLMPILICQSDLASYHFFPSAYFASYWRALTPKESWMNHSGWITGDPLFLTGLLFWALLCIPCVDQKLCVLPSWNWTLGMDLQVWERW